MRGPTCKQRLTYPSSGKVQTVYKLNPTVFINFLMPLVLLLSCPTLVRSQSDSIQYHYKDEHGQRRVVSSFAKIPKDLRGTVTAVHIARETPRNTAEKTKTNNMYFFMVKSKIE